MVFANWVAQTVQLEGPHGHCSGIQTKYRKFTGADLSLELSQPSVFNFYPLENS